MLLTQDIRQTRDQLRKERREHAILRKRAEEERLLLEAAVNRWKGCYEQEAKESRRANAEVQVLRERVTKIAHLGT